MESTLSLQLQDLQGQVGYFLGYGRGAAFSDPAWTTSQQQQIDGIVASGLRQFYFPPPIEGATSYDWSFLRPTANLDFPQNATTIPLPDDFGGFDGTITVLTTTQTSMPWLIEWRNEGFIRELYSMTPTINGPPKYAAEQALRGTGPQQGQRFQLLLFPMADQDYTLQVPYYISPDYLTGATPYAYGGAPHSETILESCLSIAEQRYDDQGPQGPHTQQFMSRLAASISMDRKNKPQKLGPNLDRSDQRGPTRQDMHWYAPPATYNSGAFG